MGKVRLSAAALRDLRQIRTIGIRDHGIAASSAHMDGFERFLELLRDNPHAGQERSEFRQGNIRSLSYRPHRILYHVEGESVVIDRIIHHARDVVHVFRGDH